MGMCAMLWATGLNLIIRAIGTVTTGLNLIIRAIGTATTAHGTIRSMVTTVVHAV